MLAILCNLSPILLCLNFCGAAFKTGPKALSQIEGDKLVINFITRFCKGLGMLCNLGHNPRANLLSKYLRSIAQTYM